MTAIVPAEPAAPSPRRLLWRRARGHKGLVFGAVVLAVIVLLALAAPLIVRRPEEVAEDRQEVVMFVQDFSFRDPAEIMAGLTGGQGGGHGMSDLMCSYMA